jgi:hypothetical protein
VVKGILYNDLLSYATDQHKLRLTEIFLSPVQKNVFSQKMPLAPFPHTYKHISKGIQKELERTTATDNAMYLSRSGKKTIKRQSGVARG